MSLIGLSSPVCFRRAILSSCLLALPRTNVAVARPANYRGARLYSVTFPQTNKIALAAQALESNIKPPSVRRLHALLPVCDQRWHAVSTCHYRPVRTIQEQRSPPTNSLTPPTSPRSSSFTSSSSKFGHAERCRSVDLPRHSRCCSIDESVESWP